MFINIHEGEKTFEPLKKEITLNKLNHDCWLVTPEGITLKNYFEIDSHSKTIDFCSGIIFEKNQVMKILTDLRVKLVRIIYECGESGAHQSHLIEALFGGTYYFHKSPKLRLKNLIAELKKIGIFISIKNNMYFYNFAKNTFNAIFPCNQSFLGPLIYLLKENKSINRKIISNKLNIKPSTASLYLKQWKERELIQKDESAKYGEFIINVESFNI